MKKKITTLAPIETVNTSVHPKPTKAEVVTALVQVRLDEMRQHYKDVNDKRTALSEKINGKIIAYAIRTIKEHNMEVNFCNYKGYPAEVRVALNSLPAEILTLKAQFDKINLPKILDEKTLRLDIRLALSETAGTDQRVNALVTNPATRTALQNMLIELGISEDSKAITI